MRLRLLAICSLLLSATPALGQEARPNDTPLLETQSAEIGSKLMEPNHVEFIEPPLVAQPVLQAREQRDTSNLPDAPRAKSVRKKDSPRGSRYDDYDPFHLGEPNRSWGEAMKNPLVLGSSTLLVGLTVGQLVRTEQCIKPHPHFCNVIFGNN